MPIDRTIFSVLPTKVRGKTVDESTRCVHYRSELDVIAIKFKCCGDFYPCYECHRETAGHEAEVWDKEQGNERAIICGRCRYVMSINEYLRCRYECPSCHGKFNPKCSGHNHLYFQIE